MYSFTGYDIVFYVTGGNRTSVEMKDIFEFLFFF
jgi:hypothetical protein